MTGSEKPPNISHMNRDPHLQLQIDELRKSPDLRDKIAAAGMEKLCQQDVVLAGIDQKVTTANADVVYCKKEITDFKLRLADVETKILALQKPAMEIATLWKTGKGAFAILAAVIGLIAGAVGAMSGISQDPAKDDFRKVLTILEAQAKANQNPPGKP